MLKYPKWVVIVPLSFQQSQAEQMIPEEQSCSSLVTEQRTRRKKARMIVILAFYGDTSST